MGMLLGALALIPLLGVVSLHWFVKTGSRHALRKAAWFAFSASVLWAWLGDYVSSVYAGWDWFFYSLLAAGSLLSGTCTWLAYPKLRRRLRGVLLLLAFPLVYSLAALLIPDSVWQKLYDQGRACSVLSRLRGPLRH